MIIKQSNKTALVFGGTGLIGTQLIQQLVKHGAYSKILCFNRRQVSFSHEKLQEHIIDFKRLKDYKELITGDDLYICLGTTMAKARSRKKFMTVDVLYPYHIAMMARQNGINQVLLVSSLGANTNSLIFYLRMKGQIEAAMLKLNFWGTHIFRPSLLLGERIENRFGEKLAGRLGKGLDFVTNGIFSKIKPIEAHVVAKAMVESAQNFTAGSFIYPSDKLQEMITSDQSVRKN